MRNLIHYNVGDGLRAHSGRVGGVMTLPCLS